MTAPTGLPACSAPGGPWVGLPCQAQRAARGLRPPGTGAAIVQGYGGGGKHSLHCRVYLTFHRTSLRFVFVFMKKSVFNFKPW